MFAPIKWTAISFAFVVQITQCIFLYNILHLQITNYHEIKGGLAQSGSTLDPMGTLTSSTTKCTTL